MISNAYPQLSFDLGETADMLRESVADFTADEIGPRAAEIDATNEFPMDLWRKMGDLGVYFATRNESGFVPPYNVEVVDTTSAGDAFSGALAVSLAEGKSLKDAVRYGSAAGALAVTRPGVQTAMPSLLEVDALQSQSRRP